MNPQTAANPSHGTVRLEIPARAEWVAVARLAVAAVASRQRFSVDDIEDIKLAVAESCTNAIQHGTPDGAISIVCEVSGDGIVLTVRDRGQGPPLSPVEEERIGESGRTEEPADRSPSLSTAMNIWITPIMMPRRNKAW